MLRRFIQFSPTRKSNVTRARSDTMPSRPQRKHHLGKSSPSHGLPNIALLGVYATVVKDAKERVRSAIISSGYRWPDARLSISFSPVGVQHATASLDLAIAVAILIASRQIPKTLADEVEFYGELSLDGRILTTSCLLAAAASQAQEKPWRQRSLSNCCQSYPTVKRCERKSFSILRTKHHLSAVSSGHPITALAWQG